MLTVSEIIRKIILNSPLLEEGIAEGIINLSALARKIQPQVQAELMKPVSESALIMALKRLSPKISRTEQVRKRVLRNKGDLTVRSNLHEYTYRKSDSILEKQKALLHRIEDRRDTFFTFTQGVYEITIIITGDLAPVVRDIFEGEEMITHFSNLSAITTRLAPDTVHIPGVHYSILKQLAWKNINVVEVVSTYTEFTIIIENDSVDRSFSILLNYFAV